MSLNKIVMRLLYISISALTLLLVIYLLLEIGTRSYQYGYRVFTEPAMSYGEGTDKLVQIAGYMSNQDIAERLQEKGLIRDKGLFLLQLKFSDCADGIEPGKYTLNTSMTISEILQVLSGEAEEEPQENESP